MIIPYPPPVQSPQTQIKLNNIVQSITWIPTQTWGYTKFTGVTLNYRGINEIEIWFDNGINNITGGPPIINGFGNQSDDYDFENQTCERFLGGTNDSLTESDYGKELYGFLSDERFL